MIERSLRAANLPDDLKYLAVHESALIPNIRSRSNAVGLWQFMRQTGRLYGLIINHYIDERRDPEKATSAATTMLKDLYNVFGSWSLVLAAYNSGMGRVRNSIQRCNSTSFVDLSLPEETERYYFKIITVKVILSQPEKFGYKFLKDDFFHSTDNQEIIFEVKRQRMYIDEIAKICGLTISQFKNMNPHVINSYLPQGNYYLKIPPENYAVYLINNEESLEKKGLNIFEVQGDTHLSE